MMTYYFFKDGPYQEYAVKFITGDKDIDGDWQEFLDKLDGCGI